MQITIVVEDKTVICDGFPVKLPALDWARFDGDPTTPWDDIAAVQYNTDHRQGHVEYRTIVTQPAIRPNIRPGDRLITETEFVTEFAWLLPAYDEEKAKVLAKAEADKAALEAAAVAAAAKAEVDRRNAIERASMPQDLGDVTVIATEQLAAINAKIAELEAFKNQVANLQLPEAGG